MGCLVDFFVLSLLVYRSLGYTFILIIGHALSLSLSLYTPTWIFFHTTRSFYCSSSYHSRVPPDERFIC